MIGMTVCGELDVVPAAVVAAILPKEPVISEPDPEDEARQYHEKLQEHKKVLVQRQKCKRTHNGHLLADHSLYVIRPGVARRSSKW